MSNYEEIKGALRLRMYGANRPQEEDVVKRDGAMYGFEGLTIIPVMELGETEQRYAVGKIAKTLLNNWNVDEDTVFNDALINMREDRKICRLDDLMMSLMGFGSEPTNTKEVPVKAGDTPLIMVSNESGRYGAATIIAVTDMFAERFPMGYTVLPSSVHEVLVLPNGIMEDDEVNNLVKDVNANVVSEEDSLSDDIYVFEA